MLRSLSSGISRAPAPPTDQEVPAEVIQLDDRRGRPSLLRITPELLAAIAEHRAARD